MRAGASPVVAQLVGAGRSGGEEHEIQGLQALDALGGAHRRPALEHERPLLLAVLVVVRAQRLSRRQLVEARPRLLRSEPGPERSMSERKPSGSSGLPAGTASRRRTRRIGPSCHRAARPWPDRELTHGGLPPPSPELLHAHALLGIGLLAGTILGLAATAPAGAIVVRGCAPPSPPHQVRPTRAAPAGPSRRGARPARTSTTHVLHRRRPRPRRPQGDEVGRSQPDTAPSRARLQGTLLHKASLIETTFVRANLRGAHLFGAHLYEANFRRARLSGAVPEQRASWVRRTCAARTCAA